MYISTFEQYSSVVNEEVKKNDESVLFEKLVDELLDKKNEQIVKEYLRAKWGLKDDVGNFALSAGILITTATKEGFFNISLKYKNQAKSFNYPKNIKNC